MRRLLLESVVLLVRVGLQMRFCKLDSVRALVSRRPFVARRLNRPTTGTLCDVIELACVFSPRKILCLQRSAATTILLKRYGYAAEMVIGARTFPFKSHAWVEVDGSVVNDKPFVREIYQVLERC